MGLENTYFVENHPKPGGDNLTRTTDFKKTYFVYKEDNSTKVKVAKLKSFLVFFSGILKNKRRKKSGEIEGHEVLHTLLLG